MQEALGPGLRPWRRDEYSLLREDEASCSHLLYPHPTRSSQEQEVTHSLLSTMCQGPGYTPPSRQLRLDWISGLELTLKLWNFTASQCETRGTPGRQEGTWVNLRLSAVLLRIDRDA